MAKRFEIRNSTAEVLTFVATGKEDGIQVLYKDDMPTIVPNSVIE